MINYVIYIYFNINLNRIFKFKDVKIMTKQLKFIIKNIIITRKCLYKFYK